MWLEIVRKIDNSRINVFRLFSIGLDFVIEYWEIRFVSFEYDL